MKDGDVPKENLEPKTPRNVIQEQKGAPGGHPADDIGQREVANEGWSCPGEEMWCQKHHEVVGNATHGMEGIWC